MAAREQVGRHNGAAASAKHVEGRVGRHDFLAHRRQRWHLRDEAEDEALGLARGEEEEEGADEPEEDGVLAVVRILDEADGREQQEGEEGDDAVAVAPTVKTRVARCCLRSA